MRGHIKLFTLQIDVEQAHRYSAARYTAAAGVDKSAMLLLDRRCHAPQELLSGK